MKKRVLSSILAGVLAVSVFAGCGSKTEDNSQAAAGNRGSTVCVILPCRRAAISLK